MIEGLDETHRILAERGLDLCEHFLLSTAADFLPFAPERFIAYTKGGSEGDPRGTYSLEDFAAGLGRWLARGWLFVLPPEDVDGELERRRQSTLPEVGNPSFEAGNVTLSPVGLAVHRAIIRALFGDDFLAESDTGFNLDAAAHRFDVYAPDASLRAEQMDRIEREGGPYTGTPSPRFIERVGPIAIGPWKPHQLVLLPAGFHGILRYEA